MTSAALSDPATAAFVVIPVMLVALLGWGVWLANRRAGAPASRSLRGALLVVFAVAVWMVITWRAAASGALRQWGSLPPPLMLMFAGIILVAVRLTFSTTGARLARHIPLWALVGVQAFRYPLEVAMHQIALRGVMPNQMTYTGLNFDIVSGISAVLVCVLLLTRRVGVRTVLAWNILGLALLTNIVIVAILSTPMFRYFGDDNLNTFVASTPFVWLPAVMVTAALAGHLLIFRAVRARWGDGSAAR